MLLPAAGSAYTLPPNLLEKARALSHLLALLYFGGTAWTLVVLGLLLRGRGDCRLGSAPF